MRLAAHRSRDSERTDARQPANKQSQPFIACGAVTLARDDLGLPILDRDAAQIRDVQAMARHWQVATVTDRERVNWVQQVITHDSADALQDVATHHCVPYGLPWINLDDQTPNQQLIDHRHHTAQQRLPWG